MTDTRQRIMTLNAGSGSLRVSTFDWDTEEQVADAYVDWTEQDASTGVHTHADALHHLLATIDVRDVAAVGHRVVHGGATYQHGVRIDAGVKREIDRLDELAPLHNRAALAGIQAVEGALPAIPQVAVFDTSFHQTLPPQAYLYALPYDWSTRWGVWRFGFHGLSYAYCTARAAEVLEWSVAATKLVVCHLGSGCSLAAIDGDRSVATTMGFTPLEGLVMSTRSGSLGPGLVLYLLAHHDLRVEDLQHALNNESGLKGVPGLSGDMRDIVAARDQDNAQATLAFTLYIARVREGIGAMVAALGGLDALVFTDAVGEHMAEVRTAVCHTLNWMGIELDQERNAQATADVDVATVGSWVRVLVLHTREDLMVARETRRVIEAAPGERAPAPRPG